jgi:hypothetical protein
VTPGRVLAELEALAGRLGIAVRAEPFGRGVLEGHGGLCWVDGKALIVMDEKLGIPERIAVLAGALARFDLDAVSVAPVVRERIEDAKSGKRKRPSRKVLLHPGIARARARGRTR